MFKILMITFAIFSSLVFANEEAVQTEQMDKCEKIYDECSAKCEQNEETNNGECFSKCEALQEECQKDLMETTDLENSSN